MTQAVAELRRRTRVRGRSSWQERYLQVFAVVIGATLAAHPVSGLLRHLVTGGTPAPAQVVSGLALLTLGLLAVLALARALGPIVLSPGDTRWLLPTPLDRRAVLLPAATRLLVIAAVIGTALGVAALAIVGASGGLALPLVTAVTLGVSLATAGIAATVLVQPSPATGTWFTTALIVAAALAAVITLAAMAGITPPWPRVDLAGLWPGAVAAAAVAGGTVRAVWGSLRTFPARTVRDASVRAGNATNLTIGLEPALVSWVAEDAHFRSVRLRSAPWPRLSAPAVIAWADWRTLARRPRRLVLLALTTLIPALADGAGAPSAVILFVGALAAAATGTSGVRRDGPDGGSGALPRTFGPSPAAVRAYRAILPAALSAAWLTCAYALLLLTGAVTGPVWLAVGGVTAPALAAAALRMARRGPVDHSLPHLDTPAGPIPTGPAIWLLTGLDLALLGTAPLLLTLLAGAPLTWPVVATQAATSSAVLAAYLTAAARHR